MTVADTLETFFDCCKNVVQYSNNDYAKAYAKTGIELFRDWTPQNSDQIIHAIRVQCLYILSNMTHWRGDLAKRVRADLKLISKD